MRELEGKGFDLISLNVHGSLIFHSSAGHPVVQTVLQVRRADVTPAPHSTRTYTRIHTRTHTRRCGTVSVWFGSSVSGFGVCLRPACRRVQAAAVQSAGWDDREQPLSPSSTGARLWRVRVEQSAPVGSLLPPPSQPCHVGRAVPTHAPFSARGSERRAPMTAAETGEGGARRVGAPWSRNRCSRLCPGGRTWKPESQCWARVSFLAARCLRAPPEAGTKMPAARGPAWPGRPGASSGGLRVRNAARARYPRPRARSAAPHTSPAAPTRAHTHTRPEPACGPRPCPSLFTLS